MRATDSRYSGRHFCLFLACAFCGVVVGCSDSTPTAPTPTPTPATTAPVSMACRVGQTVGPGQSCTVGADRQFEVDLDGRGCLVAGVGSMVSRFCSGARIAIEDFAASRVSGTNDWRIEATP